MICPSFVGYSRLALNACSIARSEPIKHRTQFIGFVVHELGNQLPALRRVHLA
jgi:hypothetical protein